MSNKKRNSKKYSRSNLSAQEYQSFAKTKEPPRSIFKNCLMAFFVGGAICCFGQGVTEFYMYIFKMSSQEASDPTVATLILIAVILTSLGIYDKFAQFAGAGSAVPVTGFANSVCSAALEHRSEGLVLGVGGNMFKLAGSVIVFGTVAAFFVGIAYMVLGIGGH